MAGNDETVKLLLIFLYCSRACPRG